MSPAEAPTDRTEAHAALLAADRETALGAADLERLAAVAKLLGRQAESFDLSRPVAATR